MRKIHTILIEDEPLAGEYLSDMASKNSDLHIVGIFDSPKEAINIIESDTIDLVISDIQMPHIDGLSFLQSLRNPPLFVFVTAHPEYAIDGFNLDVTDYILKPFLTEERLSKAINKVKLVINYQGMEDTLGELKFKDGHRTVFVNPSHIIFLQSWGDYVRIITKEDILIIKSTLKELETILPKDIFVRIHRSYMVNTDRIKSVEAAKVILKNGQKLNIGLQYKNALYQKIGLTAS